MKRREPFQLAHVLEDLPELPGLGSGPTAPRRFAAAGPIPLPSPPSPGATRAAIAVSQHEKRIHIRFDKTFLVMVGSELYGDTYAIARNVSAGGILVEMPYAPPLGTVVTVHFQHARGDELDEIVARAEVKHHHYLNFTGGNDAASSRAIGMRFLEFVDANEPISADRLH
ncbi:MAG TPA: PilZ domain-containing protein [Kofleriaceae bacterium]|nr:PilZ domain-containing protein [Kofleriaceae bacterium]